MRRSIHLFLLACSLLQVSSPAAMAEVPRKAPLSKYAGLWTDSPFTAKPPPPTAGPASNPLEDYSLAGVSPIGNGYRVTLLNKKQPDERIFVFSDQPNAKHGFKILGVERKQGDPMGTVVRLQSGALTGTVSYDEKLLTIATPQQKPNAQGQPKPPGYQSPLIPCQPNPNPNPNPAANPAQRQPRPRVVAPPAPQIQPPPIPQIQPAVQPNPNQQRPIRR